MKGVSIVVFVQLIFLSIEDKLAVSDTIGVTSHSGAEISLTFIIDIAVYIRITIDDIFETASVIRHPQSHNTTTVIRNLHGQSAIRQSVERDFLTIDFSIEIIVIQ